MFPYRVKYTESESDIKVTISFTKTPNMPTYFQNFGKHQKSRKLSKMHILFCDMYKFYIICVCNCWNFCKFHNFVFWGFLFIYTYTCWSLYVVVSWCRGGVVSWCRGVVEAASPPSYASRSPGPLKCHWHQRLAAHQQH